MPFVHKENKWIALFFLKGLLSERVMIFRMKLTPPFFPSVFFLLFSLFSMTWKKVFDEYFLYKKKWKRMIFIHYLKVWNPYPKNAVVKCWNLVVQHFMAWKKTNNICALNFFISKNFTSYSQGQFYSIILNRWFGIRKSIKISCLGVIIIECKH